MEYYFGNCKLTIKGDWQGGELALFTKEQPYQYEITAEITDEPVPLLEHACSPDDKSAMAKIWNGWMIYNACDGTEPERAIYADKTYELLRTYGYKEGEPEFSADALNKLRVVFDAALPMHGGTALHASCVKYKGYAICFCAPSGTGKSTHAKQWESRFSAPMISSDTPTVFPGKDGAVAYGMPWDGSDHIITQESLPIKAIVELRQAKRNSIRRLTKQQAFRMLLKQGHMPLWDEDAMFMEMAVLKKLAGCVPYYRLNCLPEESAAELAEAVLFHMQGNGRYSRYKIREEETEMKVKEGFVLRNVMDEHIVMPTGGNMKKFEGALVLSETSAFVWEKLQKNVSRSELIDAVLDEYDVDRETAEKDVDGLFEKLKSFDVLEELD